MEQFTINKYLTDFNINLAAVEFHLNAVFFEIEFSKLVSDESRQNLTEALRYMHFAIKSFRKSHTDLSLDENVLRWSGISFHEWQNQFYFCKTRILTILSICESLIKSNQIPEDLIPVMDEIITAHSFICSLYDEAIIKMQKENETENFNIFEFDMEEILSFFCDKPELNEKRNRMLFAEIERNIDAISNKFEAAKLLALTESPMETSSKEDCHTINQLGTPDLGSLFREISEIMSNCFRAIMQLEMPVSTVIEKDFFSKCHDHLSVMLTGYRGLLDTLDMKDLKYTDIQFSWLQFSNMSLAYNMIIDSIFFTSKEMKEKYRLNEIFIVEIAQALLEKTCSEELKNEQFSEEDI